MTHICHIKPTISPKSSHNWNGFNQSFKDTFTTFEIPIQLPDFILGINLITVFWCLTYLGRCSLNMDVIMTWICFPYYWPFAKGLHQSPAESQGSQYSTAWQPTASKTANWASGFWQSFRFLQNHVCVLWVEKILILEVRHVTIF